MDSGKPHAVNCGDVPVCLCPITLIHEGAFYYCYLMASKIQFLTLPTLHISYVGWGYIFGELLGYACVSMPHHPHPGGCLLLLLSDGI